MNETNESTGNAQKKKDDGSHDDHLHEPKQVFIVFGIVALLSILALSGEWLKPEYIFGLILAFSLPKRQD